MSFSQNIARQVCAKRQGCSRRTRCDYDVSRTFYSSLPGARTVTVVPGDGRIPFVVARDQVNVNDVAPISISPISSITSSGYGQIIVNTAGRYFIAVNGGVPSASPATTVQLNLIPGDGGPMEVLLLAPSVVEFAMSGVFQLNSGDILMVVTDPALSGEVVREMSTFTIVLVG